MASPPRISELKHTVFMSYAHDDDIGWNLFVTNFNAELNRGLVARLRDLDLPRTHFDTENGPMNGPLDEALKRSIKGSFAMMLFVHDGYVASKWCLQEIKLFKTLFGEKGFTERLFIVAMSEAAIKRLEQKPDWIELFPKGDLVWKPFYQDDETDVPMNIYSPHSRGKDAVVANDFWERFVKLREAIVKEFRRSAEQELTRFQPGSAHAPPPAETQESNALESLVYIEGEPGQALYWESLGKQVAAMWDTVVALEPKEPQLLLRPTGLPMHNLQDRPRLDNADGVILLWADKAPESLLAQIAMVEPKLQGPRIAPGLIAYLMEVGKATPETVPATLMNWPVVRFATRPQDGGSATVLAEDMPKLAKYLRDILTYKRSAS